MQSFTQKCFSFPNFTIKQCICSSLKRHVSLWSSLPFEEEDEISLSHDAFESSKRRRKIDLSMGVYRDELGRPVLLNCVRKAEKILNTMNLNKKYLPPLGSRKFRKLVAGVSFGKECPYLREDLNVTVQGLARTGSLKIATTFIKHFYPGKKIIYIPRPTWPNYKRVILGSSLQIGEFRFYNFETNSIDVNNMFNDIRTIPKQAVILLDECGQTPTGIDPTHSQWDEFSNMIKARDLLVIMDLTSQGFASGDLEVDAYGLRKFIADDHKLVVLQSFSKNMCLYGERVGACTFLAENKIEAENISSQVKILLRSLYSNPPLHGARIVTKVLDDTGLQSEWQKECKQMATRLKNIRTALVDKLKKQGSIRNWEYVKNQKGSYGFLGLNKTQVKKLRDDYYLFLTANGSMYMDNVNMKNVEYIAYALHLVTKI